jgi:hypothetical protein
VFVSSHLMSEMALTADHLIVIGRGRLIADTTVEQFVRQSSGRWVQVRSPEPGRLARLLRGGLAAQLIAGSALACALSNLPAAAALRPAGTAGLWAAILATAIGPGLLLTGSVAALICGGSPATAGRRVLLGCGPAGRARPVRGLLPGQRAPQLR